MRLNRYSRTASKTTLLEAAVYTLLIVGVCALDPLAISWAVSGRGLWGYIFFGAIAFSCFAALLLICVCKLSDKR
jgi:hypothetical protein